jgi:hypothetical protein
MNLSDDKKKFYERTMHTPDDETRAAQRASLREISKKLIPLHRALIDDLRAEYSATVEPVEQPTRLLRLINEDPFFAWLKPMTTLIVDIDELARRDFETADLEAIVKRIDSLFGSAEGEFSDHYKAVLQRSVDVAAGHASLRAALSRFR